MLWLLIALALSLDNGLGKTPQMGWNSWNKFHCTIDQTLIRQTADRLLSLGLAEKGYQYVNIDDCWQVARDPSTNRIQAGQNFPSGMKNLADYIHSKGLLFGLYSDSGTKTCAGRPGSLGYEEIDAQVYAEWTVDYLKYDNCYNDKTPAKVRYTRMRDALNKTGRPIFYSICNWGEEDPWQWGNQTGNSWRTTFDIEDKYASFIKILDRQVNLTKYGGPGGWNDPDMLEVGNGGMNNAEYQSHFALWAILKAPLLIGCDLNSISPESLTILSNHEIIDINQDPLGQQGSLRKQIGQVQLYACSLHDKSVAIVVFNRGEVKSSMNVDVRELGVKGSYQVRDLVEHQNIGTYHQNTLSVQDIGRHGVKVLRITAVKQGRQ